MANPSEQKETEINKIEIQFSQNYLLMDAITQTLSKFITETNPFILFNGLLDKLLELTKSEYGFIGEVFYSNNGQPYIQSYATTNIAWSDETRKLHQETADKGLAFTKLNSLYGEILKTGKYVLSNDPANDPRSGGLPKGHPPLNKFLGLPFYSGETMLGVVGIANKSGGYDESLIDYLAPFLSVCGNIIQAYRNNQQQHIIKQELQSYKLRIAALIAKQQATVENKSDFPLSKETMPNKTDTVIHLGENYTYYNKHKTLQQGEEHIPLTKKETMLLHLLITNHGQLVTHREIESYVWEDVIVSESSLRALVLRLRKKLTGLTIKTISGLGFILL